MDFAKGEMLKDPLNRLVMGLGTDHPLTAAREVQCPEEKGFSPSWHLAAPLPALLLGLAGRIQLQCWD